VRAACVLPLALFLAGCGFTTTGDRVRDATKQYGAQAMDEGLANAEFFICRAASVGSVYRRYGRSKETAQAWKTLCLDNPEAIILESPQQ